ncbi:hypothetical protein HAP48_0004215 [Bradyrhizobium septentrionale]|uniref:Uncharacterized protein n=1 Tax=Bradyrhizobium septentrionale TaxID=1404411 RepID=A0A973W5T7_9BRAD|nr:hypothetical protein [Bradyrhizobium septentrionale]UGY16758.1 hypothetical protein HAP48_0004215 [Bradyrhizobium septentrionale]
MPATVNITISNDADFYTLFQFTEADGITPISIVGATFIMGVRRTMQDPAALFMLTSTSSDAGGISIWDGPNGIFAVLIKKERLQKSPVGLFQQSLVCNLPASNGRPALTLPIWSGTLQNNMGASR